MPQVIHIIGNDGSGKSTYAARFAARAQARKLRVIQRHYYQSAVRSILRGAVEWLAAVARRKTTGPDQALPADPSPAAQVFTCRRRGPKTIALLAFLWVYQTAMAVELRLRAWFCRADLLLLDRSFVDDLVSISQAFSIEVPVAMIRWSVRAFPHRRIVFLSAGHEVEFARIAAPDCNAEFHRLKGRRYERMVDAIEAAGGAVRRVSTALRRPCCQPVPLPPVR